MSLAEEQGVQLFRIDSEAAAAAAALHFHAHGFVVLVDALQGAVLQRLAALSAELIRIVVQEAPSGNRGHHRYSMGRTTVVAASLAAADSPAVCAVLREVWGSDRFGVQCTGGDFSLPGAEGQELHIDMPSRHFARELYSFRDPAHPERTFLDLPAPVVKVYFPMVDFDDETGPPRFVPGSQWRTAHEDVPSQGPEPPSVRSFCPRGSALLMDQRVWHGGTPNLSQIARPMLSVHYAGPWYNEDVLNDGNGMQFYRQHRGAIPPRRLRALPPLARRLCRGLEPEAWAPEACSACGAAAECGRTALRGLREDGEEWFCLECWASRFR